MDLISFEDPVKNTIKRMKINGYTFGSVIKEEFFLDCFRIKPAKTAEQQRNNTMLYAKYMGSLRAKLLTDMNFALRTKSGVGQEIVHPSEQTEWAQREFKNEITKLCMKTRDRLINIETNLLTDSAKKQNSDAVAQLSFFTSRSVKRLGW